MTAVHRAERLRVNRSDERLRVNRSDERLCVNRSDEGQIMVMTVGFMLLALVLILVVATITAIQLDRTKLWDIADAAALHAASSLDDSSHFLSEKAGEPRVHLTDASVAKAAREHLAATSPGGSLNRIRIVSATSPDGTSALVVLDASSSPGLLGWLKHNLKVPAQVGLRVESTARAGSGLG